MLIYLSPLMPPFFLIAPVAKPKSGALSVISNDSATKVRLSVAAEALHTH